MRYAYDVAGRRIAKRVYSSASGGTIAYTRFVYQGSHVSFEADSVGNKTLRYTWGLAVDDLLAVRDSLGNHYYIVQDQLRSVRGLVKRSDGAWQVSWRYGPWGRGVDSAGTSPIALRYRWTGREYDAEPQEEAWARGGSCRRMRLGTRGARVCTGTGRGIR